jgi:hypothetical protein
MNPSRISNALKKLGRSLSEGYRAEIVPSLESGDKGLTLVLTSDGFLPVKTPVMDQLYAGIKPDGEDASIYALLALSAVPAHGALNLLAGDVRKEVGA